MQFLSFNAYLASLLHKYSYSCNNQIYEDYLCEKRVAGQGLHSLKYFQQVQHFLTVVPFLAEV